MGLLVAGQVCSSGVGKDGEAWCAKKRSLGSTTGTGRMKLGRMGRRGEEAINRMGSRILAGTRSSSGEDGALVAAASKGRT